jgi:hypothetical protein
MDKFTKQDVGAMLMIDGAVIVLLVLGIITWAIMSGDAYTRVMAWRDLKQGLVVALLSGPFFVILCKLIDKAEVEALRP